MKVKVIVGEGYYDSRGWIEADTEEGELVGVMWHPIDGPTGAVLMSWGDFKYYKMDKVESLDQ